MIRIGGKISLKSAERMNGHLLFAVKYFQCALWRESELPVPPEYAAHYRNDLRTPRDSRCSRAHSSISQIHKHVQGVEAALLDPLLQITAGAISPRCNISFWLRASSNGAMVRLASAMLKKVWLRSTAKIQRSTFCTPFSTWALSFGLLTRAGKTAT